MDTTPHTRRRLRRAWPAAGLAAVAALLLAACTFPGRDDEGQAVGSTATATPPAGTTARQVVLDGTTSDVVTGLEAPWSVVRTGTDGDALISERDSARILELADDGSTRVVGTVPGVRHGGEGGLLGLALHDDALFVYSTAEDGNRVQRFPLEGAAGTWALRAPTTIVDGLPSNSFHNGGRVAFGPDDMLYVSVGDAGQRSEAQERGSLAGKILRYAADGEVPTDNPFPGSPVWSLGHRNVQGMAWTDDGTMFAAEFGENTWDELNVIEPGANHGWPEVEGTGGEARGFVDPVQQWSTDEASPSGITAVGDTVFVANLKGEVVRAVPAADPGTSTEYFAGDFGRIRTVLEGPDDTLWFVTNNTDGRGSPGPGDDRIVSVPLHRD